MNRKQRRALGIKDHPKTYNLNEYQVKEKTKEAIKEAIVETKKEAVQVATKRVIAAMTVALHDQFGFGKVRLERWMRKATQIFECIEAETVSCDDLIEWCKEELKIQIL